MEANMTLDGEALLEIRDSRLYRIEHGTFEAYCKSKWGMSRTFTFNTIESSKATKNVLNCEHSPKTESQARPLTKLPAEKQPEAWEKAVESAGGEQPTAKQAEDAANERTAQTMSCPCLQAENPVAGRTAQTHAFRMACP